MAVCAGALRSYLEQHECLPDDSLIAMVPVSVRTGNEADTYQNRVSALLAELATNERDPLKRLRRVQQSMTAAKENLAAIPAELLMTAEIGRSTLRRQMKGIILSQILFVFGQSR